MIFYYNVFIMYNLLCDFSEEIDETNLNEEASYVRDLMLRRRGALDCHKLGDTCKGVIRCCGTSQCYWSDGFSLIKARLKQ